MATKYAHPYDSRQVEAFLKHYRSQFGGAIPVYRGERFQSGAGLGNILASIGRFLLPIIAPAASTFIGATLRGKNEGKSIKEAAKEALMPTLSSALKASSKQVHNKPMAKQAMPNHVMPYEQQGSGRRRRRSKKLGKAKKKRTRGRKRVYKRMIGGGRKRRASKKKSKSSGRRNKRIRYLNPAFANF